MALNAETADQKKNGRKPSNKKEMKCWNCDEVGHIRRKCPKPRKEKSSEKANVVDDDIFLEESYAVFVEDVPDGKNAEAEIVLPEETWAAIEQVKAVDTPEEALSAVRKKTVDLYDSGATCHMTPHKERFTTYEKIAPRGISGANKETFFAEGLGDIWVTVPNGGKTSKMRLTGVLHAPKLAATLVSVGQLEDRGDSLLFSKGMLTITDWKDRIVATIPKRNRLYTVEYDGEETANAASDSIMTLKQFHQAMGHASYSMLKNLVKNDLVSGVKVDLMSPTPFCETCLYAKGKRKSIPNERLSGPAPNFGDIVHSDLWGRTPVSTNNGKNYYVSFTDDATRLTHLYLLRNKSDAFKAYKEYSAWVKTNRNTTIKRLHSDRGGEYVGEEFQNFLKMEGTEHILTVHDTPEQNGVAERLNGILMEKVRAMLHDSQLPKNMWGEAVKYAVWLKNRMVTKPLQGRTPWEVATGQKPDLSMIKAFGQKCWVLQPKSKLDGRVVEGKWIGIDDKTKDGHRIYWPANRSVTTERNVSFEPTTIGLPELEELMDDEPVTSPETNTQQLETHIEDQPIPQAPADETPSHTTARIRKPSQKIREIIEGRAMGGQQARTKRGKERGNVAEEKDQTDDEEMGEEKDVQLTEEIAMIITMSEIEGIEPRTMKEAKRRSDWEKWWEAMEDEIQRLEKNKTWELVEKPKGANVIGSKWVYRIKKKEDGKIDKYRARLVAQGFSQIPGIDYFDTFAPVAKTTSIRVVLTFAARNDWPVHQMDVKSAYLNGVLDSNETIYIRQPPGFINEGSPNKVLHLKKALYGLKQSGRRWYQTFSNILSTLKFTRCESDHAVFVRKGNIPADCIIIVHVDDLTVTAENLNVLMIFKKQIMSKLEMTDLGELHWLLGIEIKRDYKLKTISLSQRSYIQSIIERYGLTDAKPVSMPLDPHALLSKEQCPSTTEECGAMRDVPYREAVGSLMYAALATRPDIAYAVHHLARFGDNPGKPHWEAVKRVIRYLKGTKDMFLVLGGQQQGLNGYTDADGMSNEDRHAISGYVFQIDGSSVSWSSKRQEVIALSTTEAEYVATTHAAKEALWLRNFTSELFENNNSPTTLYSDNQSSIALTKDDQFHSRTKHIDIKYHFIRWIVNDGKIILEYCPTEEMIADIFTKALPSAKAKHFAAALGLKYLA
jgi:Reverse transcriptase (RNA-dependent DNA polymerase)/Integrase core domain/GAG-pre-integrase domain/Zinc knuckle